MNFTRKFDVLGLLLSLIKFSSACLTPRVCTLNFFKILELIDSHNTGWFINLKIIGPKRLRALKIYYWEIECKKNFLLSRQINDLNFQISECSVNSPRRRFWNNLECSCEWNFFFNGNFTSTSMFDLSKNWEKPHCEEFFNAFRSKLWNFQLFSEFQTLLSKVQQKFQEAQGYIFQVIYIEVFFIKLLLEV